MSVRVRVLYFPPPRFSRSRRSFDRAPYYAKTPSSETRRVSDERRSPVANTYLTCTYIYHYAKTPAFGSGLKFPAPHTLALTVAAVPASLAGMNVPNGFEEASPALFWSVAAALGAASAATFWSFMRHSSSARKGLAGARVDDLRALRFVLQSMDELDDAMRGAALTELKKDKASLLRALSASAGDDRGAAGDATSPTRRRGAAKCRPPGARCGSARFIRGKAPVAP